MKNNIIPKLLMSLGALVYLLGIWRTCPLFSGKGYFLGVLVMGMFAILAHLGGGLVCVLIRRFRDAS